MSYDVIVVGGGSGGAVVAARLSEDPNLRVLLIEAGPLFLPQNYPPVLSKRENVGGGDYVWEKQASTGTDHTAQHLRAKVLGGGSALNAAAFVRAPRWDFERWAKRGLTDWSHEQVLPYFKKLERTDFGSDEYHGRRGPMPVHLPAMEELTPANHAFYQAALAKGYPAVGDINGNRQEGIAIYPVNVVDGIRQNTGMVYLTEQVRQRKNLEILGNRMVDTVLIENRKVIGVQLSDGARITAENVFLCAGSAGTAPILLRSGIGPADDLRALEIPLIADLPVGQNLQEQPTNGILIASAAGLAQQPPIGTTLWTKSTIARPGELDLFISQNHFVDPSLFPTGAGFQLFFAVGLPDARGKITLASRAPLATPKINLNLLGDERDLDRMVELVKITRDIMQAEPLRSFSKGEVPGVKGGKIAMTDDEIRADQKANVKTNLHLSSTAPMGAESDPNAVVDNRGKVLGIQGLHVADASIFPDVPSQATNPDVIMAAEYLSDLFKQHNR